MLEFALVSLFFFTMLLGVMEFGRWLYTLNAASEATRLGARMASACSIGDADITLRMQQVLSSLQSEQISVAYSPVGCTASTCKTVTVSLVNANFTPVMPFFGVSVPLPSFATSLPRELMNSTVNGVDNPACL